MNLSLVIAQLRTYCPLFAGRVAGAAQFKRLDESSTLAVPAAFVIPLDDNPGERMSLNDVRQPLLESFAVIVAIDNTPDERGQSAVYAAHDTVRAQLWAALLGWQPDGLEDESIYRGIEYQGGNLLELDRARLWYQYDFAAYREITPEDGWQNSELAGYPHFDGVTMSENRPFDVGMTVADPDAIIDVVTTIPKTGILP